MSDGRKVIQWASEHYEEFLIVCGLRNTGTQRTTQIWQMLNEDGLEELGEMMAMRMLQFYFEDDPGSVQADKEDREEMQKRKRDDS